MTISSLLMACTTPDLFSWFCRSQSVDGVDVSSFWFFYWATERFWMLTVVWRKSSVRMAILSPHNFNFISASVTSSFRAALHNKPDGACLTLVRIPVMDNLIPFGALIASAMDMTGAFLYICINSSRIGNPKDGVIISEFCWATKYWRDWRKLSTVTNSFFRKQASISCVPVALPADPKDGVIISEFCWATKYWRDWRKLSTVTNPFVYENKRQSHCVPVALPAGDISVHETLSNDNRRLMGITVFMRLGQMKMALIIRLFVMMITIFTRLCLMTKMVFMGPCQVITLTIWFTSICIIWSDWYQKLHYCLYGNV